MKRRMIVGNWKMNGAQGLADELLSEYRSLQFDENKVEPVLLVPFVYLAAAKVALEKTAWKWGAQNCHHELKGAKTGEVSASMLQEFDCSYVLVGHSERRMGFFETDEWLRQKYLTAIAEGILPILCVGETAKQRENGEAEAIIGGQIKAIFDGMDPGSIPSLLIVAYEPIWAIGTGQVPSLNDIEEMHTFIREKLSSYCTRQESQMRLLYGGSLNAANAKDILAVRGVDGGLIGGASLHSSQFIEMVTL